MTERREDVGLRELRQHASDLVRRAQAGERVTISVSGRPAATLGPINTRSWRTWPDIVDVFTAPMDDQWTSDRELITDDLQDPWERG